MASFYSNAANEEDILPTTYSLSQKLASYPISSLPNDKAYASQSSVSESYQNWLSCGSILAQDNVDTDYILKKDDRTSIPPVGFPTDVQHVHTQLNIMSQISDYSTVVANPLVFSKELMGSYSPGQNPLQRGLCLSLGSNQHTNSSRCSLLSSNIVQSEDNLSQDMNLKSVEYLSFDLSGRNQDTVKYEVMNDFQKLISSNATCSLPSPHQTSENYGTFCDSKYLKAARDLLDEVVNVHRALETSEKGVNKNLLGQDGSKETAVSKGRTSAVLRGSTINAPCDLSLSPSERQHLQNKLAKLVSMIEEVDKRYKRYFHQMQAVVSSFDMMAGRRASKPYSALALKTISRQFRSLRDAIKKQIQNIRNNLGDQDATPDGQGVLSRLRHVDQKLRQQKVVQQFGIMRQPWRPQRGLPETAVAILRAWLFEHFLNPYPQDSEKVILARQTGLTRSQVANWFINARVRLWKPMIEDIYKEEFGDAETEPKSSPEHAPVIQEISAFEDTEGHFQESLVSSAADGNILAHSVESRHDVFSNVAMSYEAGVLQENEVKRGLTHLQNKHSNKDMRCKDMILECSMGNQVSLALGYTSGEIQSKDNDAESS